ncbi:transposase [Confluentimicrobium naphthalenivorans]|uniref:Transposase n=1 Tax=Actibacterium naphthalenivorans TaxID=1614693 RepID=A0A840CC25_9RHOB|nr:transposase [Actibacterium naphthalenivorans]
MEIFIGLDVSLASTAVCVLGERGKILKEADVISEPEALVSFFKDLPYAITGIGLEAGPLSQWLHKGISEAGQPVVLMETRRVKKALNACAIKTDRRVAQGIARLLQMGWFSEVHCKSVPAQETRALLTARKAIQNALINLELSVRGVLRNFGLKIGPVSKVRYDVRIRELAAGNTMLQAAVDDPTRFRRSRDIGPWVGLTPGRDESGERSIAGAITKAGDAGLRAALYKAANVMALLQKGGLRREFPFPLRVQATRTISAVPRALKRFMSAMRTWISAVKSTGQVVSPNAVTARCADCSSRRHPASFVRSNASRP